MDNKRTLEDFGYGDYFESVGTMDGLSVARVMAQYKQAYRVITGEGEYWAKITGRHIFKALSLEDYPTVGDWVTIAELPDQQAVIHQVLPRKTLIKRKAGGKNGIQIIAANIDVAFVIESIDRDFNLNRFERYFAIVKDGGVQPAIILNKADLIDDDEALAKADKIRDRFGNIDFILTSTVTNQGLDALKATIAKGRTYCFLGSSGVGKSTLINKLMGKDIIKTSEISIRNDRGKHTTTHREMYILESGGIVIDNPGMREVGMADTEEGINRFFDEITALAGTCKFFDCTHIHEPGCAVLSAVSSGRLDEDQYKNYIKLKKEAEYFEMTELEKKKKDNQFGKFVKKAKKELKRHRHKDY